MIGHPRDLDLFAHSEGSLESRDEERIAAHLTGCSSCDRRVRSYRALRFAVSLPVHSAIPRSKKTDVTRAFSEPRGFILSPAFSFTVSRREWISVILFSLLLGGWAGYLASNQGKNISSQAHSIYSYYQIRYFIFTGSMTAVALIGLILAFVIPVGQNLKSKRASILLWSQPILSCALSFFAMTVGVNKTEAWPPWQRPAYPALWTSAPMSLSLGFLLTFFLASIRLAFSRDKIMKIHGYGGILFIFIFLYALIHIVWRTG